MPHYLSIHYLRAVAALMVATYHIFTSFAFMFTGLPYASWLKGGVDIFFVISGFVMVTSTSGRTVAPRAFMADRIFRIVPLYWVATLAMMGRVSGQWELKIKSLLFIPAINPKFGKIDPILEPGWTLNYEMWFYALFALTLFARERHRLPLLASLFGMLALAGALTDGGTLFQFYTRSIILEFIAGMAIARFSLRAPAIAVPVGFAMMALLHGQPVDRLISLGLPATLIVAGALNCEEKLPDWAWARLLGSASYAIYLFHLMTLGFVIAIWPFLDGNRPLFVAIALAAILVAGVGVHQFIERPLLAWKAQRRRPQNDTALSAPIRTKPTAAT